MAHPLPVKLPVLSTPAELKQGKESGSPPTRTLWKATLLTCFLAPSRIRESLVFDDLVFQDFNLLYFEIEIPEPARDSMLTADVLNFLWLQQLRKSIPLLSFLPVHDLSGSSNPGCLCGTGSCVHPPIPMLGTR